MLFVVRIRKARAGSQSALVLGSLPSGLLPMLHKVNQKENVTGRLVYPKVEHHYASLGEACKGRKDDIISHPRLAPSWEGISAVEVCPPFS